jgi:hypothetical protein
MAVYTDLRFESELVDFIEERINLTVPLEKAISTPVRGVIREMGQTLMHREFKVELPFHAVDMFLGDTPPAVADFERLPSVLEMSEDELTTHYIVYAVVLKKANHTTFIYCGSMAGTNDGSRVRASQYKTVFELCLDDVETWMKHWIPSSILTSRSSAACTLSSNRRSATRNSTRCMSY